MQSRKPSKKQLKQGDVSAAETSPVIESKPTRAPRTSKAAKEMPDVAPAKIHRRSPVSSSLRSDASSAVPAKAPAASAGASAATSNTSIIDPVGIVAASPISEAPVSATSNVESKPAYSREEIARLAYSYWAGRGFTHGLADEDWIRAEAELLARG